MLEAPPNEGHGPPSAILAWSRSSAILASRRSQALAEYWTGLAAANQPDEALALQIGYWAHWVDDYMTAAFETLSALTPPRDEPPIH